MKSSEVTNSTLNDVDEDYAYLEELLKNLTANGTVDLDELLGRKEEDVYSFRMKLGFYLLSFIVALVGNICVITVILRTKSLRTKFNIYIVNLAIADLMMPLFCMWIHFVTSLSLQWSLGKFLCKIHTFVQVTIVCASVFTLTTVTLDRFLATMYQSATWITQTYQQVSIAVIWILSFSVGVPWVFYQSYEEIDWIGGHEIICESHFPSLQAMRAYYVSFFVVVFIVPVLLMFTLIVITVLKDESNQRINAMDTEAYRDMRRKAVFMTLTVVIVFSVCWTPQQSLLLWDIYRDRHKKVSMARNVHFICLYMAYSTSAINPVIYYLYNKCFRHALHNLVKSRCRGESMDTTVAPAGDVIEITVPRETSDVHNRETVDVEETVSENNSTSGSLSTVTL